MPDSDAPPLFSMPIVGRQWRSITLAEYAATSTGGTSNCEVLPLSDRDRRFIGFIVESWLEDWWSKNSQA